MDLLFLIYATVKEKLKWIALYQCKSNVKQQCPTVFFLSDFQPIWVKSNHQASLSRSPCLLFLRSSLNDPTFSLDLQTHPRPLPSLYRKREAGNFKSTDHSSLLRGHCTSLLWCGWPPLNWRRLLLLNSDFPLRQWIILTTNHWQLTPPQRAPSYCGNQHFNGKLRCISQAGSGALGA